MQAESHSEPERAVGEIAVAERRVAAFDKLVDWFIEFDPYGVKLYVEEFRERHPGLTDRELANRLTGIKSVQNGFVGAATSIPGFLAMPITVPADLLMTWKIQINLALSIACVYGHELDQKDPADLKTDLYMILAGSSAKDCLRVLGVELDAVTQKGIRRYVGRELMGEIWRQVGRHIAMTATRRTAVKLSRMIPLVSAPIGFAYDYAATKSVGAFARQYFGNDFRSGRDPVN